MNSTRIIPLLALGVSILAEKSAAQTSTTTNCSSYSVGTINCQSQTSPDASAQLRAATAANERSFNEFFAALQARRDRNALAAERERMNVQLVAELAVQREEARAATRRSEELSQDRDETARQAQEASMRAEEVRDQARLDLFSQRADFIRSETLSRLPLIGIPAFNYAEQSGGVLKKLFIANSLATNAEITEALGPVNTRFVRQDSTFRKRFRDAVVASAAQYKVPRRDFVRFRQDAWVKCLELYRFDLETSPAIMKESVDIVAKEFNASPAPKAQRKIPS